MKIVNLKKEVQGSVEQVVAELTEQLKAEGFGVLTRIDFHAKIKEKLGKDIAPVVILGACNPQLAFEAYRANSDVASLMPCNAVVRELGGGRVSVELAKASAMMEMLGDAQLTAMAVEADAKLAKVLERLRS